MNDRQAVARLPYTRQDDRAPGDRCNPSDQRMRGLTPPVTRSPTGAAANICPRQAKRETGNMQRGGETPAARLDVADRIADAIRPGRTTCVVRPAGGAAPLQPPGVSFKRRRGRPAPCMCGLSWVWRVDAVRAGPISGPYRARAVRPDQFPCFFSFSNTQAGRRPRARPMPRRALAHAGAGLPSRAASRATRSRRSISIAGVTTSVSTVATTSPPAMALDSSVQYCVEGAP